MMSNNPRTHSTFIDDEMREKLVKLWGRADYEEYIEAYSKLLKEGQNVRAALNRLIKHTNIYDISEYRFIRMLEDVTSSRSQQPDEEKSIT